MARRRRARVVDAAVVAITVAVAVAAGAGVATGGCGSSAERTAGRFVARYFVEANQESALELASGAAAERLKKEIEETRMARAVGGNPADGRRVYYEVVRREETAPGRANFVYRLEVEFGGSSYFRDVALNLEEGGSGGGGGWKVVQFAEMTDAVPAPAPTTAPAPTAAPAPPR